MSRFTDEMKTLPNFFAGTAADLRVVKEAETKLGLQFSGEYKDYVLEYGVASVNGHELTGVCPFPRLDVVQRTNDLREINPDLPKNLYVIESLGIDNIIILQDKTGHIFWMRGGNNPRRVCSSLSEYIK